MYVCVGARWQVAPPVAAGVPPAAAGTPTTPAANPMAAALAGMAANPTAGPNTQPLNMFAPPPQVTSTPIP